MEQGRRTRVLAVDDIRANLLALEAALGKENEVIFARSGAEAIAHLTAKQDVDVILMDIQMPGMDGYEAARRIKQLPNCAQIPLIFITAIFREDPEVRRGYEAGAVDHVSKPFDPQVLRMKVGVFAAFRHRQMLLEERERQLTASAEVLRAAKKMTALLESPSVGLLVTDKSRQLTHANEEAMQMLGCTSFAQLLGWWNSPGRADAWAAPAAQALTGKGPGFFTHEGRTLAVTVSSVRDAGGAGGLAWVLMDAGEHREAGVDLEHGIQRLLAPGDASTIAKG